MVNLNNVWSPKRVAEIADRCLWICLVVFLCMKLNFSSAIHREKERDHIYAVLFQTVLFSDKIISFVRLSMNSDSESRSNSKSHSRLNNRRRDRSFALKLNQNIA